MANSTRDTSATLLTNIYWLQYRQFQSKFIIMSLMSLEGLVWSPIQVDVAVIKGNGLLIAMATNRDK